MDICFRNTVLYKVVADISSLPEPDRPEIVFSGKSNVGKSSLLNALADNSKLCRVSGQPGKTRLVFFFNTDDRIFLVDLPGYGFAKASIAQKEKYSELVDGYFGVNRPIALVLHLMDARHKPGENDRMMLRYLSEQNIPFFIVFTKADKLSSSALVKQIKENLSAFEIPLSVPVFCVSSLKKRGVEELRVKINGFVNDVTV